MFSPYNSYIIYVRSKPKDRAKLICVVEIQNLVSFAFNFNFNFFKGKSVEVRLKLIIKLYYIFKYTSSLFFFSKSLIVQLNFCGISSGDKLVQISFLPTI